MRLTARQSILLFLGLALLATAVSFWPSLFNGITNWDDEIFLTNNALLRESFSGFINKILFSSYCRDQQLTPLIVLTFALEHCLVGMNFFYYHLDNLLLHLTNVSLVFLIFYWLSKRRLSVAFLTALLFGLHPTRVESVAWIAERKDMLYALFFLGSLALYLIYKRSQKRWMYLSSLLLFLFSTISKGAAVTLPLLLFVVDAWMGFTQNRRTFYEKVPFIGFALYWGIASVFFQADFLFKTQPDYFHNPDLLFTVCYAPLFYLTKLLVPSDLSCVYATPQKVEGVLPAYCLASPFFLLLIFALIIYFSKKHKSILFGGLFFFIGLIPAIEMIPINTSIVYDRYTYIPSLGVFFLIAEGFVWLYVRRFERSRHIRRWLLLAACAGIGILSVMTIQRCHVWKNSYTLWTDVIRKNSKMSIAYNGRGVFWIYQGKYREALSDLNRAIGLEHGLVAAINNRGVAYLKLGKTRRALADFNRVLRIQSNFGEAYTNRVSTQRLLGRLDKALQDADQAMALNPELSENYYNHAVVNIRLGRLDEAIRDFTQVLSLNPGDSEAYKGRGDAYTAKEMPEEAIADYTRALKINPQMVEACNNRGYKYAQTGDYAKAIEDFQKALSLDPNFQLARNNLRKTQFARAAYRQFTKEIEAYPRDPKVHYNRGTFFADQKDYKHSLDDLSKAIELDPTFAEAHLNRGSVYQEKQMNDRALADYRQALSINPGLLQAYFNQGLIYEKTGRRQEAILAYQAFVDRGSSEQTDLAILALVRSKVRRLSAENTPAVR